MSRKSVNQYPNWMEDLVKTGIANGRSLDNIWADDLRDFIPSYPAFRQYIRRKNILVSEISNEPGKSGKYQPIIDERRKREYTTTVLHVPIPKKINEELKMQASKKGVNVTALVRDIIISQTCLNRLQNSIEK